jgi:hypothetical protein
MSKMITGLMAASALIASTALAFADDTTTAAPTMIKASNGVEYNTVCHHDGEVVQGPNGLLVCHQRRPVSDVHFKSSDWFRGVGARAAASNE